MAPLVAARVESPQSARKLAENKGWTVDSLKIPEVSYQSLFSDDAIAEEQESTSCGAGFCAAAGKVKNDLACETRLKFHFAGLLSTQLMILRCQNSTANTT